MSRKGWILISLSLAIVALVAVVMVAGAGAAGDVTVSLTASKAGDATTLRISVTNGTGKNLDWLSISGTLPQGTQYVSSTPAAKVEDGMVKWFQPSGLAAGMTLQGFEYTVTGSGAATAKVEWKAGSSSGTATSSAINVATAAAAVDPQRRGCLACHTLADKKSGKYTLAYEAQERAEISRGIEHPKVAPDGTSLNVTEVNNVTTCLQCHYQGSKFAIALADIVHPAHMGSQTFVGRYGGNCFTCHTVGPQGTFEVINDKVDVNDKGIQKNIGRISSVPSSRNKQ